MKPTEAQVEERLPVWKALSEFFLDTDLQPKELEQIAQSLAATNYSEQRLEEFLNFEVCVACRWNIFSGRWGGFEDGWLRKKIISYYDWMPWLKKVHILRHRSMYERYWNIVKPRISQIRAQKINLC